MKFPLLILFLLSSFFFGQQKEYTFKLKAKKFKKEFLKTRTQAQPITLYSIQGQPIVFLVKEYSISEAPIENIYTFKGKSQDDTQLIYFTLAKDKISGAYSQNGVEFYFEPISKCNRYKVYRENEIQVGQEHDVVE